ncbi:hypothetical protein HK097_006317, partial [Rhizophlyctis rosea]
NRQQPTYANQQPQMQYNGTAMYQQQQPVDPRQRRATPYDRPVTQLQDTRNQGQTGTGLYQTQQPFSLLPTLQTLPMMGFDPAQTLLLQQVQLALTQKQAVMMLSPGDLYTGKQVAVLQQVSLLLRCEALI